MTRQTHAKKRFTPCSSIANFCVSCRVGEDVEEVFEEEGRGVEHRNDALSKQASELGGAGAFVQTMHPVPEGEMKRQKHAAAAEK